MEKPDVPILNLRIKNRKLLRSEARQAKREYDHFLKEIEPIEIDFCNELFESKVDYKQLYNDYLLKLNQLVEYLNYRKYKIIQVDSYFFEKNYRPVEKSTNKLRLFDKFANQVNIRVI